jgi:hypothetical protein
MDEGFESVRYGGKLSNAEYGRMRVDVQSYRFPDIASKVPSVGAEVSQSV